MFGCSDDTGPVDVVVYADVSVPYLDADIRAEVDGLRGTGPSLDEFRSGSRFATAAVRGRIVGCARAVRSPDVAAHPLSPGLRALGPDRYAEWLAGGSELAEVTVDPDHRGRGVGAALQRAVLTPARAGWAQLTGGDVRAGAWLRRHGWVLVAAERHGTGEVLLDPRHRALDDGSGSVHVGRTAVRG